MFVTTLNTFSFRWRKYVTLWIRIVTRCARTWAFGWGLLHLQLLSRDASLVFYWCSFAKNLLRTPVLVVSTSAMWENRSHSIVTPPCLAKHCLTLLDNSLHLSDQALNGFLWFVKVTHLERRKICCYWEQQESVLQVRKVTQKGSYQNVLCFSSAIGIHSDSLPEWLLGNETAPTLYLSAGRVF